MSHPRALMSAKWQNGRLQTPVPLHKHWQTSSTCQNQLCQNSWEGSEVYVNQANTELRKRPLKNGRKALWQFYFSCYLPSLAQQQSWNQQPVFPVWTPGPWFWREQSRPYSLIIVFVCPNLSGGQMKDCVKCCLCFDSLVTQAGKGVCVWQALLKNFVRQTKNPQLPGDKRFRWRHTTDCLRPGRKSQGEILWEIRTIQKCKRLEKTLSFYSWLLSKVQRKQEVRTEGELQTARC